MIINNKKAYFVKNETRNNTNTKKYNLLNNNFIFEASFKFIPIEETTQNEFCVIGRTGYNMGIFTQSTDAIKWCWWEVDTDNNYTYHDIFVHPINNQEKNKIKVIKSNNKFTLYLNDEFYSEKEIINNLHDYSEQTIFIGVANPYSIDANMYWFNGDIYETKIYHSDIETADNLYLWYDFENNSKFKTFDKSGNGNHGQLYETEEFIYQKNLEFNEFARPAKII
jgi:hypothetical protein